MDSCTRAQLIGRIAYGDARSAPMHPSRCLDRDSATLPPSAAEVIPQVGGVAIALAMPFALQACGPPPPAVAPIAATSPGTSDTPRPGGGHDRADSGYRDEIAGGLDALAPVVRVSLGWYPPDREREVASLLDYTSRPLGDEIKQLPGLLWYHSGIDRERHAIVNVSLWRDVPRAEQMGRLQSMLDLGGEMTRLGVQFVRPIANSEPIWTVTGVAR